MQHAQAAVVTWQNSRPAPCGTHHIAGDGRALYPARYDAVLPFHAPGLAPARCGDEAFHIRPDGRRAYAARFTRTFGFYDDLAAVVAGDEWFHIHPDGRAGYAKTWRWCGNFQQRRCAVRDGDGRYYHITRHGASLPGGPHRYAGDFREDAAVVRGADGLCRHIDRHGEFLHDRAFFDLDAFHKGIARARDSGGWFHLTRHGDDASDGRRYCSIEPFYNGQALARTADGAVVVVDEGGEIQVALPRADAEYRAELHDISVSFWRPLTMRLGVLLGLAGGEAAIVCPTRHREIVARAWRNLGLPDDAGKPTELGARLAPGGVECDRLLYWTGPQFAPWAEAESRIQRDQARDFFIAHADHAATFNLIQRTMDSYATDDWSGIAEALYPPGGRLSAAATVVDVGGGKGALLAELSRHRGRRILLDLPAAIVGDSSDQPDDGITRIGMDFFRRPLPDGDVYIFARVLHDLRDDDAATVLAGLADGASVVVIDREDDTGRHGLMSLNMLLTTGSRERTRAEWQALFAACGLTVQQRDEWRDHVIVWLRKSA